jgi:hypothetical protein
MAADVLMGNDQDATRWIRAHRLAAPAATTQPAAAVRTPDLVALPGGAAEGLTATAQRPAGSRPRINRRALAAAAAMRDAGARDSGRGA